MKITNIHEREMQAAPESVGALLDSLSSPADALWPRRSWPPMILDRPLSVGATGGHGPVRYVVDSYTPGQAVTFRFTGPKGFDGYHRFEVVTSSGQSCILRHTLKMNARGPALLSWPLVFRPLHDAVVEDSLARGQASLGLTPKIQAWSLWVRLLRWAIYRGRPGAQITQFQIARRRGAS